VELVEPDPLPDDEGVEVDGVDGVVDELDELDPESDDDEDDDSDLVDDDDGVVELDEPRLSVL
jgi:hypothetical protein